MRFSELNGRFNSARTHTSKSDVRIIWASFKKWLMKKWMRAKTDILKYSKIVS